MFNSIRNLYLERGHLIQFSPELTGLCLQPQEPGGQIRNEEQECDLKKNIVCCAGGETGKNTFMCTICTCKQRETKLIIGLEPFLLPPSAYILICISLFFFQNTSAASWPWAR
jgi:hypothetical protein